MIDEMAGVEAQAATAIARGAKRVHTVKLVVIDRDGNERVVSGEIGVSVMETLKEHGCDELVALCGGCCSCATCHVYVDDSFTGVVPRMSADENELLEGSGHRRENSRLSCQLKLAEAMNGMTVTVAPQD